MVGHWPHTFKLNPNGGGRWRRRQAAVATTPFSPSLTLMTIHLIINKIVCCFLLLIERIAHSPDGKVRAAVVAQHDRSSSVLESIIWLCILHAFRHPFVWWASGDPSVKYPSVGLGVAVIFFVVLFPLVSCHSWCRWVIWSFSLYPSAYSHTLCD